MFRLPPPACAPTPESKQYPLPLRRPVLQEKYPGYAWEMQYLDRIGNDHTWGPATLEAFSRFNGGQASGFRQDLNHQHHAHLGMTVTHDDYGMDFQRSVNSTRSEAFGVETLMNLPYWPTVYNGEERDASSHGRRYFLRGVLTAPRPLIISATEEAAISKLPELAKTAVYVNEAGSPIRTNKAQLRHPDHTAHNPPLNLTAEDFRLNRMLQLADIVAPEGGTDNSFDRRTSWDPRKRRRKNEAIQMELHRRGYTVDKPSSKLRRTLRREAIFGKPDRGQDKLPLPCRDGAK